MSHDAANGPQLDMTESRSVAQDPHVTTTHTDPAFHHDHPHYSYGYPASYPSHLQLPPLSALQTHSAYYHQDAPLPRTPQLYQSGPAIGASPNSLEKYAYSSYYSSQNPHSPSRMLYYCHTTTDLYDEHAVQHARSGAYDYSDTQSQYAYDVADGAYGYYSRFYSPRAVYNPAPDIGQHHKYHAEVSARDGPPNGSRTSGSDRSESRSPEPLVTRPRHPPTRMVQPEDLQSDEDGEGDSEVEDEDAHDTRPSPPVSSGKSLSGGRADEDGEEDLAVVQVNPDANHSNAKEALRERAAKQRLQVIRGLNSPSRAPISPTATRTIYNAGPVVGTRRQTRNSISAASNSILDTYDRSPSKSTYPYSLPDDYDVVDDGAITGYQVSHCREAASHSHQALDEWRYARTQQQSIDDNSNSSADSSRASLSNASGSHSQDHSGWTTPELSDNDLDKEYMPRKRGTRAEPSKPRRSGGGPVRSEPLSIARKRAPYVKQDDPIPVPNLTKKSRGRMVPTTPFVIEQGITKQLRLYTCTVEGCGKCFARGEHLKRHIRSIHTRDRPYVCPQDGCGKSFSRHDNLKQHLRVHGVGPSARGRRGRGSSPDDDDDY